MVAVRRPCAHDDGPVCISPLPRGGVRCRVPRALINGKISHKAAPGSALHSEPQFWEVQALSVERVRHAQHRRVPVSSTVAARARWKTASGCSTGSE